MIKKETVRLVITSDEGTHLYTGIVMEDEDFVVIKQVVAGELTGRVFSFRTSLVEKKKEFLDNTVNYYISDKNVRIDKK